MKHFLTAHYSGCITSAIITAGISHLKPIKAMAEKVFIGRNYDAKWALTKLVLTGADIRLLQQHLKDDRVSILIKESKNGKKYAEIDTWQPSQLPEQPQPKQFAGLQALPQVQQFTPDQSDDLPF